MRCAEWDATVEGREAVPLAGAVAVATVGVLPLFLTGSLAVQIKGDLDFGASGLGLATASFFGTGAAVSAVGGRLGEALGPVRTMRLTVATGGLVMAGIAAAADSLVRLVVLLALGGLANAVAQPATNLYLARVVPADRQGLAFGVKQAAIPAAGLLGGLAVPLVAQTVGWRWAFVVGAAGALLLSLVGPVSRGDGTFVRGRRGPGDTALRPLLVLALGGGFGAAAAASLGVFLASGAVDVGLGESGAGYLVAGSSVVGLGARMVTGARADRRGTRHLPVVATMMALGVAGFAALALGIPPLFVLGAPIAYAAGWGWPGLFMLAIVRLNPGAPGTATGITQTGTSAGSVVGPVAFGLLVEHHSYSVAWAAGGASLLVAAATITVGRRLVLRARPQLAVEPARS